MFVECLKNSRFDVAKKPSIHTYQVECLKNSRFDVAVRNPQSIPTRLNVFVCIFRTRVSKV